MKVTLVGNGRMGQQIAGIVNASDANVIHKVLDVSDAVTPEVFEGSDAIIDFTVRNAFLANYKAMIASGVPVVVGTTGWDELMPQIAEEVNAAGSSMLYSANFSLGVNVFFRTLREAARLIAPFEQFDIALSEQHHTGKADFPSGTAIKAAQEVLNNNPRKRTIVRELEDGKKLQSDELQVSSIRLGTVFGVHSAIIDSESDTIELTHTAKNRTGFASGAVRAAEWLAQQHAAKPGFYTMDDFLNDLFSA